ncbi:MAG TPA: hypothetical protein VLG71_01825, partial [Candidatus Limnocylindria bacterium]|nr:hypothetical protein [Candidatus Limnocylindria bacterium]
QTAALARVQQEPQMLATPSAAAAAAAAPAQGSSSSDQSLADFINSQRDGMRALMLALQAIAEQMQGSSSSQGH